MHSLFDGWNENQTIYFEASKHEVYAAIYGSWDWGCNARFVFDYVADKAQS